MLKAISPFPPKIHKLATARTTLINKSTINSFAIATTDKEYNEESMRARDSWQGLPVGKAPFSSPKVLHTHRGDDKEHQLISKK